MRTYHELTGLADELGRIRGGIKAMKAREAEIRQRLLDARVNGSVDGHDFSVVVLHREQRRFDRAALPQSILNDPRYWKISETTTVVTRPCGRKGPNRSRRNTPARIAIDPDHLIDEEDDFQMRVP